MENQNNSTIVNESNLSIFIIGAGASGLACCSELLSKGFKNVKILEASDSIGGRLRKLPKEQGFADIDIDLGGEELHGKQSEYYKLIIENGGQIFKYWDENKFYINYKNEFGEVQDIIFKPENKDLKFVWEAFEDLSYHLRKDYPDISLREFLVQNKISEDVYPLANAMVGVESGTDIDHISVFGFNKVCRDWKSGDVNYFLTNKSHVDIISSAFKNSLDKVELNTQVVKLNYSNKRVKIYTNDEKVYECDKVVLTVPITVLKNIIFEPELPEDQRKAINILKMDNVGKVILKFKSCLWPENSSWIIIPGLINCYWSTTQGKQSNLFLLTGMTAGEECRVLNKMYKEDKKKFIDTIITDLSKGLKVEKKKLMKMYEDCLFFDWADMPFIRGGYSYPVVNEGNIRDALRQSVNDKIFFAGEATAEWGHLGTIHGAIESGYRVAEAINSIVKMN